ncbi:conserved exported hypothetical protein [Gammaproteobacteria bacterium]
MRAIHSLMAAVALFLGAVSLPAAAAPVEGFQNTVLSKGMLDKYQNAAFNTDIQHLSIGQAAAILGGAVLGGTVTNMALDGTVFTLIGVLVGATLGSEWYERGMWPF